MDSFFYGFSSAFCWFGVSFSLVWFIHMSTKATTSMLNCNLGPRWLLTTRPSVFSTAGLQSIKDPQCFKHRHKLQHYFPDDVTKTNVNNFFLATVSNYFYFAGKWNTMKNDLKEIFLMLKYHTNRHPHEFVVLWIFLVDLLFPDRSRFVFSHLLLH